MLLMYHKFILAIRIYQVIIMFFFYNGCIYGMLLCVCYGYIINFERISLNVLLL